MLLPPVVEMAKNAALRSRRALAASCAEVATALLPPLAVRSHDGCNACSKFVVAGVTVAAITTVNVLRNLRLVLCFKKVGHVMQ